MSVQLPKTGKYSFLTEPFDCDFSNHIFLGRLGNAMLNAADFHSNERGYGMHYLQTIHKTWVLSRLAIEMNEMPEAYAPFQIETWVDSAMKFFTSRNFVVTAPDNDKIYGYGRSIWAMIDTQTRQPTNILNLNDGRIKDYVEEEKICPIEKPGHIKISKDAECVRTIDTYYNDVDVNGHINSVKYIEHILNLFDVEWHRVHRIKRLEIAYVAEGYQGDRLKLCRERTGEDEYRIRIKVEKDGKDIEIVRSLAKFIKE